MEQQDRLLEYVGRLLRAFHVNERAFPIAEGRLPYSPHVFQALGVIAATNPCRASDLSKALAMKATTTSSLIARLVRMGLVARSPHPSDGRAVALTLTEEGNDVFAAIRRQDRRNMELMLSGLSEPDREAFVRMFGQVAATVDKAASTPES